MLKLLLLAATAAAVDDAATQEGRKFAILLAAQVPDQNPGKIALARDGRGVRGLIAAQPFAAGDVLISVPLSRCLVELRDMPAMFANAPPSFTWDVRLALRLHDAILTPGTEDGDPFWLEYGQLLPRVGDMGLPLLKRGAELEALGPALAEPARAQQKRLREYMVELPSSVLPALDAPEDEWPGTLSWTWALVRSRVFSGTKAQVRFNDGTEGATDRFAFVPFVDMANHDGDGSAVVDSTDEVVRLRATRDLRAGDAITISYGDIDKRQHYALYGYWKPDSGKSGRGLDYSASGTVPAGRYDL
jgi:hypothetical protein